MSTPVRFVRRIANYDVKARPEIIDLKKTATLVAVCNHFGYKCKTKAEAKIVVLKLAKEIA